MQNRNEPEAVRTTPGRRLAAIVTFALLASAIATGCERAPDRQYSFASAMSQLDPKLQTEVQQALLKSSGTPGAPRMLGADRAESQQLARGAELYQRNCEQCHGVSGAGDGPAAEYLNPRPRDYRRGIFKFTSTPYGSKPRREDLLRTIQRGVVGTSMPSFRLMPKRDLDAVLDYVLALTHRGELEEQLIANADAEGELTEEMTADITQGIVDQWNSAADNVVEPATKMPPITAESIAAGAEIFQKRECFKCHGRDGRGGLAGGIEVGADAWGRKDPAADLTSGMLHGGQSPIDIYRRMASGINGTPMPGFKDSFPDDPDALWRLTHYVLSLSNQRRRGVQYPQQAPTHPIAPAADVQPGASASPAENAP